MDCGVCKLTLGISLCGGRSVSRGGSLGGLSERPIRPDDPELPPEPATLYGSSSGIGIELRTTGTLGGIADRRPVRGDAHMRSDAVIRGQGWLDEGAGLQYAGARTWEGILDTGQAGSDEVSQVQGGFRQYIVEVVPDFPSAEIIQ